MTAKTAQPLDPRQVANLLAVKVREAGSTLREVSRRIGRSDDYLSRLLRRRRNIDVGTLYAVLEVLSLPPSAFFAELKRRSGSADVLDRDPEELLLGTIARGDLFAEIRRVVRKELAARGETGFREPSPDALPGGESGLDPRAPDDGEEG